MVKFTTDTRQRVRRGTISGLISLLDEHYQQSGKEREMFAMDKWVAPRRITAEEIQIFYLAFETLMDRIALAQDGLSPDMVAIVGMKALSPPPMQRTTVLATRDSQVPTNTIPRLEKWSVRRCRAYRSLHTESGKATSHTFATDFAEMDFADETDAAERYLVKKKKSATRNRPAMGQMASKLS